ncbi:MAG: hypothetical protein ACK5H1_03140 [Tenacibaculum sp.]
MFHQKQPIIENNAQNSNLPVKVYTVIAPKNIQLTQQQLGFNSKYAIALAYYKEKDYQKTITLFQEADKLIPNDGPTQVFIEKCTSNINTVV